MPRQVHDEDAAAQAGLAPVRHRLVTSMEDAVQTANAFGYPVVVKPRALAESPMATVWARGTPAPVSGS